MVVKSSPEKVLGTGRYVHAFGQGRESSGNCLW
jgi:hypothetical protein